MFSYLKTSAGQSYQNACQAQLGALSPEVRNRISAEMTYWKDANDREVAAHVSGGSRSISSGWRQAAGRWHNFLYEIQGADDLHEAYACLYGWGQRISILNSPKTGRIEVQPQADFMGPGSWGRATRRFW